MRKILIGVAAIIAIVIGVTLYGASQTGTIIREAVLEYAPEVMGADVSLDAVDVSWEDGSASLSKLTIDNPEGFTSDYAFKVDNVAVKLDLESILDDVIRVKEIRIDGADLIYEIGTKGNNIGKLQKNIESYSQKLGIETADSDSEARFIVDHIYITGTKVTLASDLMKAKQPKLTLPDIHLKNIGTEDKTVTAAEVGTAIFGAVNKGLGQVTTKNMLKKTLKDVTKKLGDLFK